MESTGSLFNKTSVNVDRKQLRNRDENRSPDVQIVDIQLPKPPEKKKRSRSKSLSSISSLSSSSGSRSRLRVPFRHTHRTRRWSHSRSRSPSPGSRHRHRRRHSPSYSRRPSPGRRDRDRSPRRHDWYNRGRRDNRDQSSDRHKFKKTDRYGRSREKSDNKREKSRREETSMDKESLKDVPTIDERIRWSKFREELTKVEAEKLEKLKFHEKNPEKHPQYPEEWKSFWNRRYNEIQRSGMDPSKHDFKPEWISFWTKRMKELYDEDLTKAKDELRKQFNLPEDPGESYHTWRQNQKKRRLSSPGLVDVSPPTPEKKDVMANIKTTWKALTGSEIKDPKRPLSPWEEDTKSRNASPPIPRRDREYRRQSPRSRSQSPIDPNEKLLEDMPQRKTRTSSLIFVLRKLTVLEQQLGSLSSRVFELMSQSLALEKLKEDASFDLLFEQDVGVYLETVREKLIALLCAGVVPRNLVNTARSAIKHIDISLFLKTKRGRVLPYETLGSVMGLPPTSQNSLASPFVAPPKSEPVVVPGVGQVDKAAIAQQIAVALIEQGKTNVTEVELEQLINAVVGMAEASRHSDQPMTTANFLHQLQGMKNSPQNTHLGSFSRSEHSPINMPVHAAPPMSALYDAQVTLPTQPPAPAIGALKMLQSAYNETAKPEQDSPKSNFAEISNSVSSLVTDQEFNATLAAFNETSKEDQQSFLIRLKSTKPDMYKKLDPFIPLNVSPVTSVKRSPISIPISKERSEQKLKPLATGRLSPFSSRSGGVNPTVGEQICIDDDDDDKSDTKVVGKSSTKAQVNEGTSKLSIDENDYGDDDDDDDYSFEDVCKAAQQKLKLNEIKADEKTNVLSSQDTTEPEPVTTNKDGDLTNNKSDETDQNFYSSDSIQNSQGNSGFPSFGIEFKPTNQSIEDNTKGRFESPNANYQQFRSGVDNYSKPRPEVTPHELHRNTSASILPGRPPATTGYGNVSQQTYGGNFSQNPSSVEQYPDKQDMRYYGETGNTFSRNPSYQPPRETYSNPTRDCYMAPQNRDSYNAANNAPNSSGYENQMYPNNQDYRNQFSSHDDRNRSRESQFGVNNYNPLQNNPYIHPQSNFTNQRYPY